jgi:predicted GNAT family acetyltransferase
MKSQVRKNETRSRYELVVDGDLVGIADYSTVGDRVVMPHTEIEHRHRGRGFGAVLVRGALEDIRSSGRTVVPRCWYVAKFIDEQPDFRDVLAI